MDTEGRIERLVTRLDNRGLLTPAITLYAEGVKTKIRQVYFSLEQLKRLEHIEDSPRSQRSTTGQVAPLSQSATEEVILFCDSFWDFLRSTLDILGQLINQIRSLGIDERQLDIKVVSRKLDSTERNSSLDQAVKNCINSNKFKALEAYRHCSMHRRPVYVETRTTTTRVTGTPGYYSGGSQPAIVSRYLCKNPDDLQPTIGNFERPVVSYCESLLKTIEGYVGSIINKLS